MRQPPALHRLGPALAAVLACGASAAQPIPGSVATPLSIQLGVETLTLPARERMTLAGASLLFDAEGGWWAGPAVYGAAGGQRGGFFVGGIELQRHWRLAPKLALHTGVFAGGGGGGNAPVGGGLMLRPAASLMQDLGALQAGLSWSHLRFPDGHIRSQQWGLLLAWDGSARYWDADRAGTRAGSTERSGLGFDEGAGTLAQYRIGARRIGLIGARAERGPGTGPGALHSGWRFGVEAAAAAQGDAAGYMELLASAAHDWAPSAAHLPGWRLGLRTALGLGGGGAVPTGGGLIGKAALGASWGWPQGFRLGVDVGRVVGADSRLRVRSTTAWLALPLEPDRTRVDAIDGSGNATLARVEWVASLQHNQRVLRRDGSRGALDTVGLELNRFVDTSIYLSAQAHSAFHGGAGAYSIGLVGAGIATAPAVGRWQAGAELLVGAAGGGGVNTAGGALAQGLGWVALPGPAHSQWRAGIGVAHALRGGLNSPLVELSWSKALALPGP